MPNLKLYSDGQVITRFISETKIEDDLSELNELIETKIKELPLKQIKNMIDNKLLTIEDMVDWFKENLEFNLRTSGGIGRR